MQLNFPIFPEQASSMAGQVDALYLFLVLLTTFFSLLIAILILFFAIKYRRKPERQAVTDPRLHAAGDCVDGDSTRHLDGHFCLGRGAFITTWNVRPQTHWKFMG